MNKRALMVALAAIALPNLVAWRKAARHQHLKAEKCHSLAKAGNDCASTGNEEFLRHLEGQLATRGLIYVPEGYCDHIVGGNKSLPDLDDLGGGYGVKP